MANLEAWSRTVPLADEPGVEELFRARYLEMVRLAGLLGADDPEDIAQEAFVRLMRRGLAEPQAALGYLRAIVVNLTRNRHRHLRVVRMRTPAAVAEGSSEQAAILREDHREVIAALAGLPARRREAIVLRFWLDLPEREIAVAMGGAGQDTSPSPMEALGYAHADVARVVLRAGGKQLAGAATEVADWPGSSLRLWHARVLVNFQQMAMGRLKVTATAYDAVGHVLEQVNLGRTY